MVSFTSLCGLAEILADILVYEQVSQTCLFALPTVLTFEAKVIQVVSLNKSAGSPQPSI
jgi:hypothetical protein